MIVLSSGIVPKFSVRLYLYQAENHQANRPTILAVTKKAGSWPRDAITYVKELPATGSSVDHCMQCGQLKATQDCIHCVLHTQGTCYRGISGLVMRLWWVMWCRKCISRAMAAERLQEERVHLRVYERAERGADSPYYK